MDDGWTAQKLTDRSRIAGGKMGDQAAMAAQLLLGQLACEPGPAIEQPGQAMHDPRGGAQRLAPAWTLARSSSS
jgi:hypothetical protein